MKLLVMTKEEQSILQNMKKTFPGESPAEILEDIRECHDVLKESQEKYDW